MGASNRSTVSTGGPFHSALIFKARGLSRRLVDGSHSVQISAIDHGWFISRVFFPASVVHACHELQKAGTLKVWRPSDLRFDSC